MPPESRRARTARAGVPAFFGHILGLGRRTFSHMWRSQPGHYMDIQPNRCTPMLCTGAVSPSHHCQVHGRPLWLDGARAVGPPTVPGMRGCRAQGIYGPNVKALAGGPAYTEILCHGNKFGPSFFHKAAPCAPVCAHKAKRPTAERLWSGSGSRFFLPNRAEKMTTAPGFSGSGF